MGSRRAILAQAISVQDGIAHACSSVLWLVCIDKLRQCMGAKQGNGLSKTIFQKKQCDVVLPPPSMRSQWQLRRRLHRRRRKARDRVQPKSPRSERNPRCRTRRQRRRRAESPCLPTRSWPQRGRESRKSRRQIWRWEKAMTCSLFSRMKKAQAQAQERPVSERIHATKLFLERKKKG